MVSQTPEKLADLMAVENIHDGQNCVKDHSLESTLPLSLQGMTPDELVAFKKKLVRKIDIRLMPMLILLFLLK